MNYNFGRGQSFHIEHFLKICLAILGRKGRSDPLGFSKFCKSRRIFQRMAFPAYDQPPIVKEFFDNERRGWYFNIDRTDIEVDLPH